MSHNALVLLLEADPRISGADAQKIPSRILIPALEEPYHTGSTAQSGATLGGEFVISLTYGPLHKTSKDSGSKASTSSLVSFNPGSNK
ncbi:hypothetical protein PENANT_c071G05728 [Penicillium antarcticum]|uniref:Uncharacterized protein n=1 Tax=Penicillium antarcticum TaxID=416450 RepID=A0A1V6PPK8_9EURO|nr:hypothetical protein PENANT_c071G05728 [Penicillium antarcticum]